MISWGFGKVSPTKTEAKYGVQTFAEFITMKIKTAFLYKTIQTFAEFITKKIKTAFLYKTIQRFAEFITMKFKTAFCTKSWRFSCPWKLSGFCFWQVTWWTPAKSEMKASVSYWWILQHWKRGAQSPVLQTRSGSCWLANGKVTVCWPKETVVCLARISARSCRKSLGRRWVEANTKTNQRAWKQVQWNLFLKIMLRSGAILA